MLNRASYQNFRKSSFDGSLETDPASDIGHVYDDSSALVPALYFAYPCIPGRQLPYFDFQLQIDCEIDLSSLFFIGVHLFIMDLH